MLKNLKNLKILTYLPLSLNIFTDASFTLLGQDVSFFRGESNIVEGNPFFYNIFNSQIGRNLIWFYLFILLYTSITIFIIEKLSFKKKISDIVYLTFWVAHFMGLSGWWFVSVGKKLLQEFSQNSFIWFFSAMSLTFLLTSCLYFFWFSKMVKEY
jgi:hypothetical protein